MGDRRPSVLSTLRRHSTKQDITDPSEDPDRLRIETGNSHVSARLNDDGRVDVKITHQGFKLAEKLQKSSRFKRPIGENLTKNNKKFQASLGNLKGVPKLNIAIHIVGSRGDVQPFIGIGQMLQKEPYGHRVRICTHPVFKDFVEENGLEFFSIGGDPATLMAYMVKNPGLLPGKDSWKAGDVGKRRADIAEILEGTWRSCIETGNGMGEGVSERLSGNDFEHAADLSFIADAIIANPPSYGHLHCAEKLGIPLHMMFTMPWSPTQTFPHPLASIERNGSDPSMANYISYNIMELLAWQGLGDVINGFRIKTLRLDPISPLWGHMLLSRMKVPFTYAWSSSLIPKPPDWGDYINISGFSFLKTPDTYKPPEDLVAFLEAGPPPVYIGFGSIVVDHPDKLTEMIFGAVKRAGVRALVSKGWGGLGGDSAPEGVFLLGNVPHDWLFNHVSCVVHHGGAGTTAIGIAMGKPTVIVPFFGDQPFWGSMIFRAGAGPEPVPFKKMTEDTLTASITRALQPDIQEAVKKMSEKIAGENGAKDAADSFHQMLNYDSMRCLFSPKNVAVWRIKKTNLRLSSLAAATLFHNGYLKIKDLKLVKHRDWYIEEGPATPISGVIATASGALTNTIMSFKIYSEDLHNSTHKKHPSNSSSPVAPSPSGAPLDRIPTRFPLDVVATYPADHLEMIAYKMASKTMPSGIDRSRSQRVHPWNTKAPLLRANPNAKHVEVEHSVAYDITADTGHFAHNMLRTGLAVPVSFFYQLANGFHNAPSFLFHDDTVRRRDNITGFGSGVKAAVKGGALNMFDGVTGVVTQPIKGFKKHGARGIVEGLGKGAGGFVCKPTAAVFGLPGYTLKGFEKQLEKRLNRNLKAKILGIRLKQGLAAYTKATKEEKDEVLLRWKEFGIVLK